MSERTEKNLKAWEATRAMGKWSFILKKGVLTWGGLMFVMMGVVVPAMKHSPTAFTPRMLAIDAVLWPVGGLIWGALVWFFSEKNYLDKQRSTGNNSQ